MPARNAMYIRGQREIEHTFKPESELDRYIDPFLTIPDVIELPIHEKFTSLDKQRLKRGKSLLTLAKLAIIENGGLPSDISDYALEIARQNIRVTSNEHYNDETFVTDLSMLGLQALFLAQDTNIRESPEAYVYTSRIMRADMSIARRDHFGPVPNPYEDALHTFDSLDNGEMSFGEYISQITQELDVQPNTPRMAQVKSAALFEYASTLADCEEKKSLLLDTILHASYAFSSTEDDPLTKGLTLRTLACALHDVTYLPEPFSKNPDRNTKLIPEALSYAVSLLDSAATELQTAIDNGTDESIVWPVMNDVMYFKNLYAKHADITPQTYEKIGHYLTVPLIRRFGAQAIVRTLPFISTPKPEEAFDEEYEEDYKLPAAA